MVKPVDVKALDGYRIWIKFEDGVEGELDLSRHAGRGVFKAWEDREFFEAVIVPDYDAIAWPGDLSMCGDALYTELTGKNLDELIEYADTVQVNI